MRYVTVFTHWKRIRDVLLSTHQSRVRVVFLKRSLGGKSIVYQLPPLVKAHGFGIVISPLIALAQDQVHRFAS